MSSYGQFCPVAKAMELLDERWTMLVVRELLLGGQHFNDLRRGLPKMSPTLLSKRLQTLTRAGVVQRTEVDGRTSYTLTESGRELNEVVQALSVWGVRWIGELGDNDLDPHLLMWDIHRNVAVDDWPRARTVLAFRLSGVPAKASSWWLMVADGKADICDFDPGYDVAARGVDGSADADPDLARRRVMETDPGRRIGEDRRAVGGAARGAQVARAVQLGRRAAARVTADRRRHTSPAERARFSIPVRALS